MLWLILLPFWFLFNLLAYLLAPILPLFRVDMLGNCDNNHYVRVEPRLPLWLNWFMTDDNSLCGDMGFVLKNGESYWSMVKWLWRNPAVGFEKAFLGADIKSHDTLEFDGNPQVQDAPHGTEGYSLVFLGTFWNFTYIKKIGNRCIKLDIGWQLKTYAEDTSRITTQPKARYAMSIRFPLFKQ